MLSLPPPKDELTFKKEVLEKYNSSPEGLTLRGFLEWWRGQLISNGESTVWDWLEKLGYDRDFFSVRSRVFSMSFHSRGLEEDQPIVVRIRDAVGTDIDSRTTEMILTSQG